MNRHYRYLLIDFDNTLFDFDRAEESAFHAAFSAYGLVSDEKICRLYHEINDGLWKKLERGEITRERLKPLRFEMLLHTLQIPDKDGLSRKISDAYLSLLSEKIFLLPGALDVCCQLSAHFKLCIITNGSYSVQIKHFHGSGIQTYFSDMFVSEKIGAAKPSAEYFTRVLDALGNPAREECCVIGDSLSSDIAGAASVGMDAIWLDRKGTGDAQGYPVVHILHDIRQLPACLDIV